MSLSITILENQLTFMKERVRSLEKRDIKVNESVISNLKDSIKEMENDIALLRSKKDN